MFCKHCGTPLLPNTKFCPKCGTAVISASVSSAPQTIPQKPKKSKKKALILTIDLIVAAVIVLAVSFFAIHFFNKNEPDTPPQANQSEVSVTPPPASEPSDPLNTPPLRQNTASAADRFGSVVSSGTSIYYWKYSADSLASEALFGNFSPRSNVTNHLICRIGETEQVIITANGCGNLAIANNHIFYETVDHGIYSCRFDGAEIGFHGNGTLQGVTEDGRWVIFSRDSSQICSIDATDPTLSSCLLADQALFDLCHDNKVYFEVLSSSEAARLGECTVGVVHADGSNKKILYTTAPDLYDQHYMGSRCSTYFPYVQDGYLYFSYGGIDGTGHVFQGGKVAKVDITNGGGEIVAGNNDFVDEYFLIDKAGNVTAPSYDSDLYGLTNNTHTTIAGDIVIYNADKQCAETIVTSTDYAALTTEKFGAYENHCVVLSDFEIIGKKAYFNIHFGTRQSSGDIGWRYNYKRATTVLFEKDLTTGTVTELHRF